MHSTKLNSAVVLMALLLFYLLSFLLNDWLILTMPRHQLLQLPAMFVIGILLGWQFPIKKQVETSTSVAVLILVMTSFIFWMLPRSIDMAVIHPHINRIMHFNMMASGLMVKWVLQPAIFELKIIFPGMMAAMLLATGFTLQNFNLLLCSSFTIEQQKETGLYLSILGAAVLLGTYSFFFRSLSGTKKSR